MVFYSQMVNFCLLQLVACVQMSLPSVQHMAIIPGHRLEAGLPTIRAVLMAILSNKKDMVLIWGDLDLVVSREDLDLALLKECVVPWGTGKNLTLVTAEAVSLLSIN